MCVFAETLPIQYKAVVRCHCSTGADDTGTGGHVWKPSMLGTSLLLCLALLLYVLQLFYILGVYLAGPDIASAFQVTSSLSRLKEKRFYKFYLLTVSPSFQCGQQ